MVQPIPERTVEYGEGREAKREGKTGDDCPYPSEGRGFNNKRFRWFVGWYDEKNRFLLGLCEE